MTPLPAPFNPKPCTHDTSARVVSLKLMAANWGHAEMGWGPDSDLGTTVELFPSSARVVSFKLMAAN